MSLLPRALVTMIALALPLTTLLITFTTLLPGVLFPVLVALTSIMTVTALKSEFGEQSQR